MKNHRSNREDVRIRKNLPLVSKTKEGVVVQCPFCPRPHPILPGVESPCGTTLEVMAVQTTFRSNRRNGYTCLKCGKTGGEMVRYNQSFVHLEDCMPGTKLLTEIPKFSLLAKIAYKFPKGIQKLAEKKLGKAQQVKEIDGSGKETGKILGYFFWR